MEMNCEVFLSNMAEPSDSEMAEIKKEESLIEEDFSGEESDDILTKYLVNIKGATLTPAEERDLSILVQSGDKEAFKKFALANLRLVVYIAK